MIQIESVRIMELRGIRELTLTMNRENFVVSGPNGSGKSGVVDAIEFALTGEMGRLSGSGTGDLTLAEHGPHVDKRSAPGASSVQLNVYIPSLKRSASITRTIAKPRHPKVVPDDDAVRAVFDEMAAHPEVVLSRREIIKFILTEAGRRSRDVQTLLKLEDIDQTRGSLKTTENKLNAAHATAKATSDAAADRLRWHLGITSLKEEDLLVAVNSRRALLGASSLEQLTKDTSLTDGVAVDGAGPGGAQTKETALADLTALSAALERAGEVTETARSSIVRNIAKGDADPGLLTLMRRRSFVQSGLDLLDGPDCPLCDTAWELNALRAHLQAKLRKSIDAQATREELLAAGRSITETLALLRSLVDPVTKLTEADPEIAQRLRDWSDILLTLSVSLSTVEGAIGLKEALEAGFPASRASITSTLEKLTAQVQSRPDMSSTVAASEFLIVAQERLSNWRTARQEAEQRRASALLGKAAYKTYGEVAESALVGLYEQVESDFASYYRLINHDDEGEFTAKLEASNGKLGLLVDFHKKGMFPPGAYHSEGHQDGMGVCLYLALMKRVLGDDFTLAVLDDVVMSVDSQHRKQFCKLLRMHFPNTQFVITTHDQVWAKQIRSEGLVGAKAAVAFHTWRVETGPVLDEITEVWDQIEADLAKNEVPPAAGRLRRHLEYVASDLAHELGADVRYRADGDYDMGQLLSAVIGRQGDLLKEAAKVAQSWDDKEEIAKIEVFKKQRTDILAAKGGEDWIINKAIHYNDWFNLTADEFRSVVNTFRQVLHQFRCPRPTCDSWMSLTPRYNPTDLRCACGQLRLNLKAR